MQKIAKLGIVILFLMFFSAGSVLAADQTRQRDRKRDGSCRSYVKELRMAADQTQQRDRKRDGSCQSYSKCSELKLAADQDRQRDRKRDGSCRS